MSRTIKQIADELGVSKQAVHQRIKRSPELQERLQAFMSTVDGTIYIDVDGEQIIKDIYINNQVTSKSDVNSVDINVDENVDCMFTVLQSTIETLQNQLAVKDQQIEALNIALATAQKTISDTTTALTAAQALHAGTLKQQIEDKQEKKVNTIRRSFWNKLFHR